MLARLKIVYNIVFNTIIVEVFAGPGQAPVLAVLRRGLMAAKLLKGAKVRQSRETARVPARAPAAAVLIARSIEEDIVLGRRQPRERLVEQDLSDLFNTHRGDVRLALFELEKKGIVQRIPNRGAIVRDLTPKEVTEIYAVREELEVMAARILPLPVAESQVAKLGEIQQRHSVAIDSD